MNSFFISYISSLLSLALIDGIWLSVIAKPFYTKSLSHLLAPAPRFGPAVLFYLAYAAGLSLLVVLPQTKGSGSALTALGYGALLGFIAYGTYDFTNLATLNNWPLPVSIVDLIWGTCLTGAVSLLAFAAVKRFGG
jgi:uncharacterized membrane protein